MIKGVLLYKHIEKEVIAGNGFEPLSRGPKPRRIDRYPTRLALIANLNCDLKLSVTLYITKISSQIWEMKKQTMRPF